METGVECFHLPCLAFERLHVDLELGGRLEVLTVYLFVALDPVMPGIDLTLKFAEPAGEVVQLLSLALRIRRKSALDLFPAQAERVDVLQRPPLLVADEADFLL